MEAIKAVVMMQSDCGEAYVKGVFDRTTDGASKVRLAAVEALGAMGSKQYVSGLVTRLEEDDDIDVVVAAVDAIELLGVQGNEGAIDAAVSKWKRHKCNLFRKGFKYV